MICLPLQTMDNALWNTKNWKNKVRIFIFIYQRKKRLCILSIMFKPASNKKQRILEHPDP